MHGSPHLGHVNPSLPEDPPLIPPPVPEPPDRLISCDLESCGGGGVDPGGVLALDTSDLSVINLIIRQDSFKFPIKHINTYLKCLSSLLSKPETVEQM